MADNYLERKMEDLRSGKVGREYGGSGRNRRRGGLYFPFPPKRILIASENPAVVKVAEIFIAAECKVAVMTESQEIHSKLSKNNAIRLFSPNQDNVDNLLKAWRDIDILISDSEISQGIIEIWQNHRGKYLYVSDYVCRIILLSSELPDETEISRWEKNLHSTVNAINLIDNRRDISALVSMLCLPANSIINRMTFDV